MGQDNNGIEGIFLSGNSGTSSSSNNTSIEGIFLSNSGSSSEQALGSTRISMNQVVGGTRVTKFSKDSEVTRLVQESVEVVQIIEDAKNE